MNGDASKSMPLAGLRIVDLSMFMSGPLVTLIAADLGADVIKVESLQRLDGWRGAGLAPTNGAPAWEVSPSFNWINRNKRNMTLNLADERGADILKRLVSISDVVVENYTPRVMSNFGLGYDELRKANDSVIMLSMPGFGLTGPWRDYTAFAWSTEQMSGISHLTGYEGGPPMFTGTTGGDPLAGLMGTIALLAGLEHRQLTGEGQHIDLSQLEACTLFIGDQLMEASYNGRSPTRQGNASPTMAPHNLYPCSDGRWLAVACRDDVDWSHLARAIGRPEWASPESAFATIEGRRNGLTVIDSALSDWTRERAARTAMMQLQAAGIAAGAALDGRDLLEDPHLAARAFFTTRQRAWVGVKRYPAQPFRLSRAPWRDAKPAPLLGEHNTAVLASLLYLTPEEIAELEASDITGTTPIAAR